jgi:uncharacterized SAM-dependent methyltransferase
MHLISRVDQTVHVGAEVFRLEAGESICTEYSYKFTVAECERLAKTAGLHLQQVWLDADAMFSVQLYRID